MAPTRRARRLGRMVALGAALALVAAACGGESSHTEYRDPDDLALFRVPNDWNVYEADEVIAQPVYPFATQFQLFPISSIVAFDAAPGRDVANLTAPQASARFPVGSYVVREVTSRTEKEALSRGFMQSLILWPDFFNVLDRPSEVELDLGNDFEGIKRLLFFEDVTTQERGVVYFVSVTNADDSQIYSMAVGCSEDCFRQFTTDINEVIESWVVNTRK